MPDFLIALSAPQTFTAATPKLAIAQALATFPQYAGAEGSFTASLWVANATGAAGQLVAATVTVTTTRSLTVDIAP